ISARISHSESTMARFKVLITNPTLPEIAHNLLKEKCDVIISPGFDKASIISVISGVDALLWSGGVPLDKQVLDAAGPRVKVIGLMSSGYNHVDLQEVKAKGIKIGNTPVVHNNAVADKALLLALGAAQRVTEGRWHIERGTWNSFFDTQWMLGQDISGSTVGIIGFGGIGHAIARRLKAFDISKLLYTGHKEKPEAQQLGATFVDQDTLVKNSDFIFLAAPLSEETREMCNEDFFCKMKKTGVLINISRGQVVDQPALIKALKNGEIFAAGLDVMTPEPLNTDSELLNLPNVFLSPHLGSATKKTLNAMAELAAKNILLGLADQPLLCPVIL
ncbi:glyoxylate reductase/hydroxypyruvate reductase-like, partial [Dendroctonus ponderosae]|uniref:glyoxylate reductase/hydroxypyruvate reductase-like n=1 Tax=Dendroctonus ponderosae TaxID=77166 RepID=UPI002035D00A